VGAARVQANVKRVMISLLLLGLAACGHAGAGPAVDSGIRGKVVLGPQCPVLEPANPCPDRPFQADVQVVDTAGHVVATAHSGTDGRFSLRIAPGSYVLKPLSPTPGTFPFGKDVAVTVRPHQVTRATVTFDTGIR